VPFTIKRVYYIVPSDGAARGFHAHKSLEQLLVCPTGSCRIVLDDGRQRTEHQLSSADRGLYIGPMAWREMHDFSAGCVLLVLASAAHNEADYIRDYEEFRQAAAAVSDS
jgi:dTDP-4-dehydrorhamnose 3,5-epimerase